MIFNNLRQQGQIRDALRCNDTMLSQMCAKGIDELCSLTDEEVPRPEEHGAGLLRLRLRNDKAHRRPGRCFHDRFRVGSIILLSFDERLHVSRREGINSISSQ